MFTEDVLWSVAGNMPILALLMLAVIGAIFAVTGIVLALDRVLQRTAAAQTTQRVESSEARHNGESSPTSNN